MDTPGIAENSISMMKQQGLIISDKEEEILRGIGKDRLSALLPLYLGKRDFFLQ